MEALLATPQAAVLLVLLVGGLLILGYALRTGVPPMPSGAGARAVMTGLLPQRIEGTIYDLGSGWGGLAFALARRFPNNRVVGIELSPLPWLYARCLLFVSRRRNLEFRRADMMTVSVSDAGAALIYLMPGPLHRLAPKLREELPLGSVVISYSFAVGNWPPDCVVLEPQSGPLPVYRYRAPGPTVMPVPAASFAEGTARSPETRR